MATEELLQAGIAAAKAGDIARASKLLIQVVQTDPNSELGWLWLGLCRTVPEQREYCFRRALAINPQNAEARRQMEVLYKLTTDAQEVKTPTLQSPPLPSPTTAPVIVEPRKDSLPASPQTNTLQPAKKAVRPQPRKKNESLLIWIGAGLVLFVCMAMAGIFVLARLFNARNAPIPVTPSPTAILATPTPNYAPTFQSVPCDIQVPVQARVDCGFVIVPEDRSGNISDTIRLAVVIYHSTSNVPKPDPILYLSGGPGDEAMDWSAGAYEKIITPFLSERDLIVFDARGVGRSRPVLDCDEFGNTYLQDLQGKIPADQRVSYYQGALLSCKNNLTQLGANLSAYTSVDMAADARDVIIALGYRQANLYGVSYGTRVAQFVMRNHPGVVRSAILDSVVPVETQILNRISTGPDDMLRVLFEDCKSDPACSSAYPDLEAAYKQAFDQLNSKPAHVTVTLADNRKLEQNINGYTFQNTLMWVLRSPRTIPLAPQLIYRVRDGDNSLLPLSLTLPALAFDSITMGSYISVNCHDQVFAIPMADLNTTIADMCKLWDIKPPAPGENDPVNSDIPTLIFAGRYDSTTPVSLAHQLAGHLTHSYLAEIPDQGHAPTSTEISECPIEVMSSFLQDPSIAPDLTCVRETPKIKFVIPYNANPPIALEPTIIEQYQINTLAPAGWTRGDYGFYIRNGFWGDVTQVGIQRAAVSESDWSIWLVTNFNGKRGFDQLAVKQGERQANGLTWSIYKTTSQGHPVDVAFASSGNQTLMILLMSYKDEHDALYNTVFLPILDSTKISK
jgi:pimeloyl-ACP methyl ester carboxylesterase